MVDQITYQEWYASLVKPFFAPPPEVFGIAWGIIYPLIFIAFVWVVARYYYDESVTRATLGVFIFNLVLNILFSPIQLTTQNNLLASGMIIAIVGTLAYLEYRLWNESKPAFWLLLPYLLWGSFATILQVSITVLN
jgi:benzodiazapine receptor